MVIGECYHIAVGRTFAPFMRYSTEPLTPLFALSKLMKNLIPFSSFPRGSVAFFLQNSLLTALLMLKSGGEREREKKRKREKENKRKRENMK